MSTECKTRSPAPKTTSRCVRRTRDALLPTQPMQVFMARSGRCSVGCFQGVQRHRRSSSASAAPGSTWVSTSTKGCTASSACASRRASFGDAFAAIRSVTRSMGRGIVVVRREWTGSPCPKTFIPEARIPCRAPELPSRPPRPRWSARYQTGYIRHAALVPWRRAASMAFDRLAGPLCPWSPRLSPPPDPAKR